MDGNVCQKLVNELLLINTCMDVFTNVKLYFSSQL